MRAIGRRCLLAAERDAARQWVDASRAQPPPLVVQAVQAGPHPPTRHRLPYHRTPLILAPRANRSSCNSSVTVPCTLCTSAQVPCGVSRKAGAVSHAGVSVSSYTACKLQGLLSPFQSNITPMMRIIKHCNGLERITSRLQQHPEQTTPKGRHAHGTWRESRGGVPSDHN